MQLRSFFLGRRGADEMPVVAAPVHEPADLPAPAPARERHDDEPAQASYPEPAAPIPAPPAEDTHPHPATPLPRRAGRPFSQRVSGNADNPADIPAGETVPPASQPPYRSAAPVMPAVSPDTTRGPVTKSVPQIRPVHVRPTATVPAGIYTPAQPKLPAVQPLSDTVTPPPTPEPAPQIIDAPVPPVFPQRAKQRTTARPQRPLPQAFEPEPARRVDYELSPRQFSDVDPITSGIRVRRSGRRRGNARH